MQYCSDDRTAEAFKVKIEASTQMRAVMGEEKKPNCLIIDEIDGAPQVISAVLPNMYYAVNASLYVNDASDNLTLIIA